MSVTDSQETNAAIRDDIRDMIPTLWGATRWSRDVTPCNHPVSLMRKDLPGLARRKYWVGAKADGTRAFMLFSFTSEPEMDYVALVDRTFAHRQVGVKAPPEYYSGTLLDGELVTLPDGSQQYLVFDVVAMCGYSMRHKSHTERRGEVVRAVNTIKSPGLVIRAKKWFEFGQVGYDEVARSIPTNSDGLILVPERGMPLTVGRQADHYKWKRATDHTIDFYLQDGALWLENRGVRERAAFVVDLHAPPGAHGVVECALREAEHGWVATVVRPRPDKTHPNDARVAQLTLKNIQENIEIQDIMK
jgi:hypothetical protein